MAASLLVAVTAAVLWALGELFGTSYMGRNLLACCVVIAVMSMRLDFRFGS